MDAALSCGNFWESILWGVPKIFSMHGKDWNVLRLLSSNSARMPTETYKSTTQHTTGDISHPRQCLFARSTQRIPKKDHLPFSLNSNYFSPLLFTESSLFLLFPALYPHHSECKSLPAAFSPQLTSLSFSLSHPSSYSLPSLSCLISSPTPLHSFLPYFSFFSTI